MNDKLRILLVYDDHDLREEIARVLEKIGYQVTATGNSEEAMRFMRDNEFDAVISTLSIAPIDGLDLLKSWRRNKIYVPVLILSTRGRLADRLQALEAGADDYVILPCHMEELIARLSALLRRSREYNRHL